MATRDVETVYMDAWNKAGRLPSSLQLSFRARLTALRARAARPRVSGDDDGWEWDLALANELDRIYRAVADSAKPVYEGLKDEAGELVDATAAGAAKIGFGLWPVAIAAVLVLWAYSGAAGAHRGH